MLPLGTLVRRGCGLRDYNFIFKTSKRPRPLFSMLGMHSVKICIYFRHLRVNYYEIHWKILQESVTKNFDHQVHNKPTRYSDFRSFWSSRHKLSCSLYSHNMQNVHRTEMTVKRPSHAWFATAKHAPQLKIKPCLQKISTTNHLSLISMADGWINADEGRSSAARLPFAWKVDCAHTLIENTSGRKPKPQWTIFSPFSRRAHRAEAKIKLN